MTLLKNKSVVKFSKKLVKKFSNNSLIKSVEWTIHQKSEMRHKIMLKISLKFLKNQLSLKCIQRKAHWHETVERQRHNNNQFSDLIKTKPCDPSQLSDKYITKPSWVEFIWQPYSKF